MHMVFIFQKLRLGNLDPLTSLVFCCDMQERFKPAIKYFDEIVVVGSRILKAAELLNIPVVVTEQVNNLLFFLQTIQPKQEIY